MDSASQCYYVDAIVGRTLKFVVMNLRDKKPFHVAAIVQKPTMRLLIAKPGHDCTGYGLA